MVFIRTKLATDWGEPTPRSWWERLLSSWVSNPTYEGKYHLIDSWLIEFDDDGEPEREIALDAAGDVVFAGPSPSDYGFWLDTNARLSDFTGDPVSPEEFEAKWLASGVVTPWRTPR
jgi:hypothetical protein